MLHLIKILYIRLLLLNKSLFWTFLWQETKWHFTWLVHTGKIVGFRPTQSTKIGFSCIPMWTAVSQTYGLFHRPPLISFMTLFLLWHLWGWSPTGEAVSALIVLKISCQSNSATFPTLIFFGGKKYIYYILFQNALSLFASYSLLNYLSPLQMTPSISLSSGLHFLFVNPAVSLNESSCTAL